MTRSWFQVGSGFGLLALLMAAQTAKQHRTSAPGYDDTPYLPGQKWRVHDIKRPHPPRVAPAASADRPGKPPADAIVLFDGQDLSRWVNRNKQGQTYAARWKVANGYAEAVAGSGDLVSKEAFGDAQIHVEWAAPTVIDGSGQHRGNSGVLIMSRYEIQVLDSFDNVTYADGQAGAIYGQFPPLVNASRKPGEWQTYDIVFEAPRFSQDKLVRPAYVTVLHNGVLVHHRQEIVGHMAHRVVGTYIPHAPEEPLALQDHDVPVRFRNIWVRRLRGYDQP
ncbi:MAG: DUF1080 domain-containing protein [Acidobacteria bacterium]|nr:DUF1080 domain-containing protein [Acidobacteriota bacterium]